MSEQEVEILRNDPEIKQAGSLFLGKEVPLEALPPDLIAGIAGMVERLGVQGAVAEAKSKVSPQDLQALIAAL